MNNIKDFILRLTNASNCEEVELIQSLWSGYGKISRYKLTGSSFDKVIVKNIIFPNNTNHPRGWNTSNSHNRKVKSYQVETAFYEKYNAFCGGNCRTPKLLGSTSIGEEQVIVLEDLDAAGFPIRKSSLTIEQVKVCLSWLANFHATFLNETPQKLWEVGTYWHLDTRPDEYQEMNASPLKSAASEIDKVLNNCKYKTFVHGDAKVANFCFSEDLKKVAAVDFQYVGGGCGMKDVAYLMGSCLSENECEQHEKELLNYYFNELEKTLDKIGNTLNFSGLKTEWSFLFSIAWADFERFLTGWMPTHQKINGYSKLKVKEALQQLN
ncbi:MAG: oxidoreductase family protein [Vicingaceae bacterium]